MTSNSTSGITSPPEPRLGLVPCLGLQVCGRGTLDGSAGRMSQDHDHPWLGITHSLCDSVEGRPRSIDPTSTSTSKAFHWTSLNVDFNGSKVVASYQSDPPPMCPCIWYRQGSWCQVPRRKTPSCQVRCLRRGCRCCQRFAARRCHQAWRQTQSPTEHGNPHSQ